MLCKELQIGDWITDNNSFQWQITVVGDDYAYATFEGNEGDPWEFDDKDEQPQPIMLLSKSLRRMDLSKSIHKGMTMVIPILIAM